eukprot:2046618-Rhodomonas_salina.2
MAYGRSGFDTPQPKKRLPQVGPAAPEIICKKPRSWYKMYPTGGFLPRNHMQETTFLVQNLPNRRILTAKSTARNLTHDTICPANVVPNLCFQGLRHVWRWLRLCHRAAYAMSGTDLGWAGAWAHSG